MSFISSAFHTVTNGLHHAEKETEKSVKDTFKTVTRTATRGTKAVRSTVSNDVKSVWDDAKDDFDDLSDGAKSVWDTDSHEVTHDASSAWDTVSRTVAGFVEPWVDGQEENKLLNSSVNQLRYNGDQTTLNLSASGQFAVEFGAQAQGADSITIKQVGGKNPPGESGPTKPVSYQVTLNETQQIGANETDGYKAGDVSFGSESAQGNVGVTQTVTVTVSSKEDAEKAAKNLAKIMASNDVGDLATDLATRGAGVLDLKNPIMGSINGGGGLIQQGVQDVLSLTHIDPVTASDRNFLKSHLTSYGTTVSLDANAQVSLNTLGIQQKFLNKIPVLNKMPIELNGTGKADDALSFTRTVTLANGCNPAKVSYTLGNQATASGSAGLKLDLPTEDPKNPLKITGTNYQGNVSALDSVTATYDLPTAGDVNDPEAALTRQGRWDKPDQLQAETQVSYGSGGGGVYTPFQTGPVTTETHTATVNDPAKVGDPGRVALYLDAGVLGHPSLVHLGPEASATSTTTHADITANPIKLSLDPNVTLGDLGLSGGLNASISTERITSGTGPAPNAAGKNSPSCEAPPVHSKPPAPTTPPTTPPKPKTPAPAPPRQFVVLPQIGLNIHASPSSTAPREGAFFNGSFVQATGKTSIDPSHTVWMQVRGTNTDDQPVEGWVEAQYVAPHPQGALSGTGRIDPTKQPPVYLPVVVQPGQNLSEIASQHGVPLSAIENVNGQHIIDAALIFPGDVVYVPSGSPTG